MSNPVEDAIIEARRARDALLRSRSQLLAQRDALNAQLVKVESAIEALRELVGTSPESPASPESAGLVQTDAAEDDDGALEPAMPAVEAAQMAKPLNRKARVREIMLESPDDWFTAAEMALRVEGQVPSETRRTAMYEMMRRMAKQGELERDNSAKPTRFRAQTATIRERLLLGEHWAGSVDTAV